MMLEKAAAINCLWLFPYYCQKCNSPNKWDFLCADPLKDTNTDLPFKYQDRIGGWGVQIMLYLIKEILMKETNAIPE